MDTEKKENKEVNKLSLLIVAVIVLVLIIAGAGYYIYHQKQQMTDLVETFDLEKESLEDEYNELSLQYEGYKFSVGNDSLVALLSTEQAKVQRLLEELRTVKATNAKEIARLKKELDTLRKIMRNYVVQIDSLNRENEQLKVEKKEAVQKYQRATSQAATLKKEKEKLTERVTLASRLDATDINVTPVNSRGKLAKRIKKMQQFVVTFKIAKNITAPVGEKMVYVRIMKPDDDILVKSRADVFAFEGKEINYSMKKMIEYEGEEVAVTMYWNIEEFLSPGTYRVDIFSAEGMRDIPSQKHLYGNHPAPEAPQSQLLACRLSVHAPVYLICMEKSSCGLPDAGFRIYQNYRSPGKQLHNLHRICEDMHTHQNSSDTLQDLPP